MASKKSKGARAPAPVVPVPRRAAGVDIGSTFHVAAVPPDLATEPVRSFRSFTADLKKALMQMRTLPDTRCRYRVDRGLPRAVLQPGQEAFASWLHEPD